MRLPAAGLVVCGMLLLSGCTEHATEADKAAAAQTAAAKQQQADELIAAQKGIRAAEGQLAQLPPPAKGRYLQVRSAEAWGNPFLIVSRKSITLRMVYPEPDSNDTLPNGVLPGQKMRSVGAKKRELTLRLIDLPEVLAALPEESWAYGRVVAVEEDPATPRRERPQMRRNLEAVMVMLNDLDVVVDEWPYGSR
jgi:outer membrane murein-binding lipoprotein Lpp